MKATIAIFAAAIALGACSHVPESSPLPAAGPARATRAAQASLKIKHIVFIIQENRTFDAIFGGPQPFKGVDADGAYGQTTTGKRLLKPVNLESCSNTSSCGDPNNYHPDWLRACNAKPGSGPPFAVGAPSPCQMNGFDLNDPSPPPSPGPAWTTPPTDLDNIYSYVNYTETKPYWKIAEAYGLADHFFMGHNSESYTGHQYLFSSQSNNTVDSPVYDPKVVDCSGFGEFCAYVPWGCSSPPNTHMYVLDPATGREMPEPPATPGPSSPFPCFGAGGSPSYTSLADLASRHYLNWTVYSWGLCSSVIGLNANRSIFNTYWPVNAPNWSYCYKSYGPVSTGKWNLPHWRTPSWTFLKDESSGNRPLPSITWILPGPFNSDHPGIPHGFCGPTWVAEVLNAIGGNKKDWDSTVVFIVWDDWGGFYDHVPPYVVRDQAGPGFRVPLIVVSPYVKAGGVVDHTNMEFGTLIKFAEDTLGLGRLGGNATDSSPYLNSVDDFFDFNQKPRPYTPFDIAYPSNSWCSGSRPLTIAPGGRVPRWLQMVGQEDGDGD